MQLWRRPLPGEAGFKTAIRIFNVSATCLVEDQDLLQQYLSKRESLKLRADVKKAFKFLYQLDRKSLPMVNVLREWAGVFNCWQKKIASHHMLQQHRLDDWCHLGMSLHYLLDGLYHIFAKFLTNTKGYRRCSWCSARFKDSWSKVLSKIVVEHTLATYVHLRIANHGQASITEQALDDIQDLVKMSLTSLTS